MKNFILNWCDFDNSEGSDHYEANFLNFVRNTTYSDHNENFNEKGSEQSIILSEYNNNIDSNNNVDNLADIESLDPSKALNDIRPKNSSRLVVAQMNINSPRNNLNHFPLWSKIISTH